MTGERIRGSRTRVGLAYSTLLVGVMESMQWVSLSMQLQVEIVGYVDESTSGV